MPEDRRTPYRIGRNIGDIIIEDGDGVNIAARVPGLAEPGGISLAPNVYDQITGKLNLELECLG